MYVPYLHAATSVLLFQRMDARGAVSRDCVTCAHANGDREICSSNLFREGGELDIRIPSKKKCEGTHPLEATEGGHLRTWG